MRKLNRKQKKLLREWYEAHRDEIGLNFKAEDLDIYWEVYDINDFETFNAEVERYIQELVEQDVDSLS